ncbi:MAG: hypothetical protein R3F30_09405 [Planctomycetota bacterium]
MLGVHRDAAAEALDPLERALHAEGALRAGPHVHPRPAVALAVPGRDPVGLERVVHLGLGLEQQRQRDLGGVGLADLRQRGRRGLGVRGQLGAQALLRVDLEVLALDVDLDPGQRLARDRARDRRAGHELLALEPDRRAVARDLPDREDALHLLGGADVDRHDLAGRDRRAEDRRVAQPLGPLVGRVARAARDLGDPVEPRVVLAEQLEVGVDAPGLRLVVGLAVAHVAPLVADAGVERLVLLAHRPPPSRMARPASSQAATMRV